ncbi:hypothetical protein AAU61_06385 [Desulfocarbo indianensis]|nr:hypothetical protein AAU61_06385 [Desulfocarbo indianensis]
MSSQAAADDSQVKTLLRSALAVSAPAVVAFVALISANSLDLLQSVSLSRWGVVAVGVLAVSLGHLLWRGRWWAGLPALAAALIASFYFAFKFARPMAAYLAANPVNGLGDVLHPLVILSPSLVVVVICLALCMASFKGVRLARELGPRPVGRGAWIILGIWLAVLAGDLAYQQAGWRLVKSPDDLVVRLCQPANRLEAEQMLLQRGPAAVPALVEGLSAADAGLACMRQGSLAVLAAMGPEAVPALVDAVSRGGREALQALAAINDPRAAGPLLEVYRAEPPKGGPEFQLQLRETIHKLNPALNLGG